MERKKTKNVKENKKIKNIKIDKSVDDSNEIKAFIIIVAVIVLLIGAIYGMTELFKEESILDNSVPGEINYDVVTVGTLLNRPYEEYYVLVYNQEDGDASIYSALLSKYMENSTQKDYIKIFYCDLSNNLNKEYYNVNNDNKSNPKAVKTQDFNFGDITLIEVKNGKITKYIEKLEKIKEVLK